MKHQNRRKAFTLIELLVVISIIALLLAILMPVLGKAKELAKRLQCTANVKGIVVATNIYAENYDSKTPRSPGGNWLQDFPHRMAAYLIDAGCVRDNFYCPSDITATKNADNEIFWHYSNDKKAKPSCKSDADLYNCSSFAVSGYFWLFDNEAGRSPQPYGTRGGEWVTTTLCKQPAATAMVVDSVFSNGPNQMTNNSLEVYGGLWSMGISDKTNHVNSKRAKGGNIGFVDGHMEWRNFEDMQMRWRTGPCHWW
jgi:prepilin-type N-terminal cleavage/methylation domain-containing protein/prepilin-type processing-associated H-X9-DG protein